MLVQTQRAHVLYRLAVESVEILVAGAESRCSVEPALLPLVEVGAKDDLLAVADRLPDPIVLKNVVAARMPGATGGDLHFERHPPVCVVRSCGTLASTVHDAATK